ncbi:ComEA family DNA-binding protein [Archangium primigenium]|uniref:ComEA family DNA-binding protein n=1 Tax=[Archangium] primigenium TaxID=2792470 RepID=UPI00195E1B2C|nr:helix-hairpin-helix domain-containing protein [Archangium primigenium]MBM7116915.1 helix-hairpin-helix domain-containing protein [Archangium primigenium]
MNRTGVLALAALGLLGLGVGARARGVGGPPALACGPDAVHLVDGVAHCGAGRAPSAAQRRVLGGKLDLNRVSEEDLARVPGVGAPLARALVLRREQRGPFGAWSEVATVSGVGPTRLRALRAALELR